MILDFLISALIGAGSVCAIFVGMLLFTTILFAVIDASEEFLRK